MGVYIPNMEMPPSCRYCEFRHMSLTQNAFCTAAHETIDYMAERTKRLDDCPLVPVPPHGDLIDREETKRRLAEHLCKMKPPIMWPDWNDAVITICTAPTIIEAEEGET